MPPARLSAVVIGAALFATAGCRADRAPVEELYTTRMLGLSYLQRNQLPQAESTFKKLTELAPDDPLGYGNLGLTYLQAARYREAEDALKRARELDPSSAEIGLALARLYDLTGRAAEARSTLDKLRQDSTGNAHVLYALAQLDSGASDAAAARRREDRLRDVLAVAPANLVARLQLLDAFVTRGESDSAVRQLEEVRRIPPDLPRQARIYLDSTIQLLRAGKLADARPVLDRFMGVTEVTPQYQASMDDVRWTDGPIAGRPILTFAPKYFISLHGVREKATVDMAKFVDATDDIGLSSADTRGGSAAQTRASALAAGDIDGDGTDDLFVSAWSATAGKSIAHLYRVQGGFIRDATERSKVSLPNGAAFATFADYDNDGWLDLFAIGGDGRGHLLRNRGDGTFDDVTAKAGVANVA